MNENERITSNIDSFKRLINLIFSAGCIALETAIFGYNWLKHFQHSVVPALRDFWFKGHLLEISIY